jgi:hypothetical protein
MLGDFTTHAQLVKSAPPLGPTQPGVMATANPIYTFASAVTTGRKRWASTRFRGLLPILRSGMLRESRRHDGGRPRGLRGGFAGGGMGSAVPGCGSTGSGPVRKLLAFRGDWPYFAATQQRTCLCHASHGNVVTQRRQAFWQHYLGNLEVAGSLDRFVTRARRLDWRVFDREGMQ